MSLRLRFRALGSSIFAALSILSGAVLAPSAIHAQVQAPPTAVGAVSTTQTATVTITSPGTSALLSVVTQGVTGSDFAAVAPSGGTCATAVPYTVGQTCTVQFTFAPSRPWTRYGAISIFDAAGHLLGNTFLSGKGTGPLVSYPLGATSPVAVLGSGFNTPAGVAVDASGNLYIADSANNTVSKIVAVGGSIPSNPTITTLGSGFVFPTAVAVDGAGNVYVADSGNNRVKVIVAVGGAIPASPTIVTLGSGFTNPQGVAVDGNGNVYVADTGNGAVKEIFSVNGVIPAGAVPVSLGTGFVAPNAVAVDASGDVFATDSTKVLELVAVGNVIPAGAVPKSLGTGLVSAQGVAVDSSGNVYVNDLGGNAIKEFLAISGSVPTGSAPILLGVGYKAPSGVAVDVNGDVFVADGGNGAVEELNAQTTPSLTFASTVIGAISSDSPKTATLQNIGNAPLSFSIPVAGTNPSPSAGFSIGSGSTCPPLLTSTSPPSSLAAGSSCSNSISFAPVSAGAISGSATTTDNNLNIAGSTQVVTLIGQGTQGTPIVSVGSPSATVNTTSVTLSASVSYLGVMPTGPVSFTIGGSVIPANCPPVTASPLSCSATFNPSALPVASYTIQANIIADGNYITASSTGALTITQATPTITLALGGTSTVNNTATFTATVTPNSGIIPTGKVTFTGPLGGSTSTICSQIVLVGGSATCQTTALQAGLNSISASIAGDLNFLPATATPITQTVTAASTSLAITSSAPVSSVVDSQVTYTATISASAPFTINPTGTVAFSVNGTPLTNCTSVSATTHTATCSTSSLTAAADSITATYTSGDANFIGSTATPFLQVVTKNTPTNLIASSLLTTAVVNQSVTFTATIGPLNGAVLPTGSVRFFAGSTLLCGGPVVVVANPNPNGTGIATCITSFSSASAGMNVSATYSGDSNFLAGNVPSLSQVVLAAGTTIQTSSIGISPATTAVNQAGVVLNASVTPAFIGTATPNGTIVFSDAAAGIPTTTCTSNVAAGVVAACPHVFTSAGTHTVTAVFSSSDGNFSGITGTNTVSIGAAALSINLSSSAPSIIVNQSATYLAAFSPAQPGPAGTVTYKDGGVAIPNCINLSVGTSSTAPIVATIPTCTQVLSTAKTHSITVDYSSTNSSSFPSIASSTVNEVVAQNSTTSVVTGITPTTSTVDQQVTFTASVTPAALTPAGTGATVPTGTVTFYNGSTTLCTQSVSTVAGITTASCPFPLIAAGSASITAAYNGDANFVASVSLVPVTQVVTQTATVVALVAGPTSSPTDQSATYTVKVSAPSVTVTNVATATPTGSVVFLDNASNATCPAVVDVVTGLASCPMVNTGSGLHTISASYVGDSNFSKSTNSFQITLTQSSATIAAASIVTMVNKVVSQTVVTQSNVTLSATITPSPSIAAGGTPPTGTVTFTDGGLTACTSAIDPFGAVVPCSYTFLSAGAHSIKAVYSGDTNFGTTSNTNSNVTIGLGTSSITVGSNAPTSVATQQVTFTATVAANPSAPGAISPTGKVTISSAGGANPFPSSTSCTGIAVTNGTASCIMIYPLTVIVPPSTVATTNAGQFAVTASYSGDTNYASSTTPPTSPTVQTVQNFSVAVSPAAILLPQGASNTGSTQDPFVKATIAFSQSNLSGYNDATSYSCSTPIASLTCALTAGGQTLPLPTQTVPTGLVVTASAGVVPATYAVTITASDAAGGHTSLIQTTSEAVTVVNVAPTAYVGSVGTTAATIFVATLPSSNTNGLTCNPQAYSNGVQVTLATASIVCSNFLPLAVGSTTPSGTVPYNFTITVGSPVARLETGHMGPVFAVVGAPFLLLISLLPSGRKVRKMLLRALVVLALGVFLMQSTGCSSGGFTRAASSGTPGTPGTYLIQVVNGAGAAVAEVPLVISNN